MKLPHLSKIFNSECVNSGVNKHPNLFRCFKQVVIHQTDRQSNQDVKYAAANITHTVHGHQVKSTIPSIIVSTANRNIPTKTYNMVTGVETAQQTFV